MHRLYWVIAIIQTLRAVYALTLLGLALMHRAGLLEMSGAISQFVLGLPSHLLVIWIAYVTAYGVAAGLIWLRRAEAVYVFCGAFAIDLGLWVYSSLGHNYQASFAGYASLVDMVFNVIDFGLLTGLLLLLRSGALHRSSRS